MIMSKAVAMQLVPADVIRPSSFLVFRPFCRSDGLTSIHDTRPGAQLSHLLSSVPDFLQVLDEVFLSSQQGSSRRL